MIDVYTWPTPNGHKIHIMLEECKFEYEIHPVDIQKGEQFEPAFLDISPNNRIPAIIDHDGPRVAPEKLGALYLNYLGTYPGSLGNYAGVQRQIPVITIELPYAGIMPTKDEIRNIWLDMIKWLRKNIMEEENH